MLPEPEPLKVHPDLTCLAEKHYALGTYYCLKPKGHLTRCDKWMLAEFVEVTR